MAIIRIYDLKQDCLACHLKDLLRLLAPWSLEASWTVSSFKSERTGDEWFWATGCGGEKLDEFAAQNASLSGFELGALAEETVQVIWGVFTGSIPTKPGKAWVIIRAVDSSFYEIDTDDAAVLRKIRRTYRDVRTTKAVAM